MKRVYRIAVGDNVVSLYAYSQRDAYEKAMAYLNDIGAKDPEDCCYVDDTDHIDYDECMEEYYYDDNEVESYLGEDPRYL